MSENEPDIGEMSFEDALGALEFVVRKLESGEVPLDDSIQVLPCDDASCRRHRY